MAEAPQIADAIELSRSLEDKAREAVRLNHPPPALLTPTEMSALTLHIGNMNRIADEVEAAAKAFVDEQRGRVAALMSFYGNTMRDMAQREIGKKSPRRWTLPLGSVTLRKKPDQLREIETPEEKKAFRKWDMALECKFTRIKARFDMLTRDQLNKIVDSLDDDLLALLHWEIEPKKADLNEHCKATGEVPPGFELIEGEDQMTVELSAKPAIEGGNP